MTSVVETYPNGDRYEGQVGADGTKSGWGKYTFANGKVYEGNWAQGKMNGWGEFTEGVGKDRFVGEWEDANRRFGIYVYANGDMYQGGFEKSMKHGRGIIWESKVMYEAVYSRDRLVSKVPWKQRMAEEAPQAGASPPRSHTGGVMGTQANPDAERELAAARARIAQLETKVEAQETQLMVLTKELRLVQEENDILLAGGGAPLSTGARGRAATPSTRQRTGSAPTRSRSGGPIGPRKNDKTSSVIYKKRAGGNGGYEAMNPNRIREEFRYYYNHFDRR